MEWDEDELPENKVQVLSYEDYRGELEELVRQTSHDVTCVDRAMEVFDRMFEAYVATEDEALLPDTAIYNLLLNVLAYSPLEGAADQAEAIVARMEEGEEEGPSAAATAARPDGETYATLLEARARRGDSDGVEALASRLRGSGRADTTVLNKLIQARGRRGDAAGARSVLEEMIASDKPDERPNQKTWVQVLRAYAARGDTKTVERLMGRMTHGFRNDGQDDWAPSTAAYNALIQAHARRGNAKEAELLLYRMIESEDTPPDQDSFYQVIHAHIRKPRNGAVFKVEQLLSLQEGRAKQDPALKPNERTLQTAVAAMSRDKSDPLKAVRAARLVERMEAEAISPQPSVYKSLLNACAHTSPRADPEDKLSAFQVALDAFNKLKSSDRDDRVYGQLLRTAGALLPAGSKRDAVVDDMFGRCCEAGKASDYVLNQFSSVASDKLVLRRMGGFFEDGVKPPDEWDRNVPVEDKK